MFLVIQQEVLLQSHSVATQGSLRYEAAQLHRGVLGEWEDVRDYEDVRCEWEGVKV